MDNDMNDIEKCKMRKTIEALKSEILRLKLERNAIIGDSLRAQCKAREMKRKFASMQEVHADHVKSLATALQSLVCNISEIFSQNEKYQKMVELYSTQTNTINCETTQTMGQSYESSVQRRQSNVENDEEENGLQTIIEEDEDENEDDGMDASRNTMQSMITNVNANKNTLSNLDQSNPRFMASKSVVRNEQNTPSRSSKEPMEIEYFGREFPVNDADFIANMSKEKDVINRSYDGAGTSGVVVSSISYKPTTVQSSSILLSESTVCETEKEAKNVPNTQSNRSNDTVIETASKDTGKLSSSLSSNRSTASKTQTKTQEQRNARPNKRACTPTTLIEPKLNTKLRRPLSVKPKLSTKSSGN